MQPPVLAKKIGHDNHARLRRCIGFRTIKKLHDTNTMPLAAPAAHPDVCSRVD
jgi:hypothetical protein